MARYLEEYEGLNRTIGLRIKHVRRNKGVSQVRLAQELGISYQQLQKYEYGKSQISVARLKQIADVLGISIQTFINSEEPSVPDIDSHIWLSRKEARLLKLFREIDNENLRDNIIGMIEDIVTLLEQEGE